MSCADAGDERTARNERHTTQPPGTAHEPELAARLGPGLLGTAYDPVLRPIEEKESLLVGMAMTEKQGGSDVRTNSTKAHPVGGGGPGAEYELRGHKWFCSAPMSDAFLTLAQPKRGLSCFLVPRWRPDGSRNRLPPGL